MTHIVTGEDKPPLDEIYHYGVQGMRWGRRRFDTSSEYSSDRHSTYKKAETTEDARDKTSRDHRRAKLAKERMKGISGNPENKSQVELVRDYKDAMRQYKNNPNRTRASRTILGEKAAVTALAVVTGGGSAVVGVGVRAGRNAVVRTRQNSGYYDRKYA